MAKDAHGAGVRVFSLSFKDENLEKGYAKSLKERLVSSLRVWFAMFFSLLLVIVLVLDRHWDIDQFTTDDQLRVSRYQLLVECLGAGQMLIACFVAIYLGRRGIASTACMEVAVVCSICVVIGVIPMQYKHYLARAVGSQDSNAFWGMKLGGVDANLLLAIDACVTAVHLTLPIRWKFLLPVPLVAISSYAIPAYALGSPQPDYIVDNIVGLASLAAFASLGKRAIEKKERLIFVTLLREREMRCEAEFQLSQSTFEQGRQSGHRSRDDDDGSLNGPPSTTATAKVFGISSADDRPLDSIVELAQKEQWMIRGEDVQLFPDILGEGGFGVVARGMYHGTEVAIKCPRLDADSRDAEGALPELCNELGILRRLRHPRIVFLYGAVFHPDCRSMCIVLEMIHGQPLGQYVHQHRSCSAAARVRLLLDVAAALQYLHVCRPVVVHGDLKDTNIFVERSHGGMRRAKLLDFGLSRQVTRHARRLGGTVRWVAPEILAMSHSEQARPQPAADIFSFGRVVYFVSTGELPFANIPGKKLRSVVQRSGSMQWPEDWQRTVARCTRPLVEQCTQQIAALRPSMDVAYEVLTGVERELKSQIARAPTADTPGSAPTALLSVFEQFEFARARRSSAAVGTVSESLSSERLASVPEDHSLTTRTDSLPSSVSEAPQGATLHHGSAATAGPDVLLHSNLAMTPKDFMLKSLGLVLMQWNFEMPPTSCCWLHAALMELETCQQKLSAMPCDGWTVPVGGQCPSCNLLWIQREGGRTCGFCDTAIPY